MSNNGKSADASTLNDKAVSFGALATVLREVLAEFSQLFKKSRAERELVAGNLAALRADVEEMRKDFRERPPLRMAKVWRPGESFARGDTCVFDGSTWQCLADHTANVSAFDHEKFQLIVKHGRDGKAAR